MSNETTIQIDKAVPIPPTKYHTDKYPFTKMEINDSFFVAYGGSTHIYNLSAWNKRLKPKKFISRSVIENGIKGRRVWRIK